MFPLAFFIKQVRLLFLEVMRVEMIMRSVPMKLFLGHMSLRGLLQNIVSISIFHTLCQKLHRSPLSLNSEFFLRGSMVVPAGLGFWAQWFLPQDGSKALQELQVCSIDWQVIVYLGNRLGV